MANVWSINYNDERAIVIDQGTSGYCTESAARRNAAAKRLGVRTKFLVLPDGQTPTDEDLTDPDFSLTDEEAEVAGNVADALDRAGRRPEPSPYL